MIFFSWYPSILFDLFFLDGTNQSPSSFITSNIQSKHEWLVLLHTACAKGIKSDVAALLRYDKYARNVLNEGDQNGKTALMLACESKLNVPTSNLYQHFISIHIHIFN